MGLLETILGLFRSSPSPIVSPVPDNPMSQYNPQEQAATRISQGMQKFSPDTVPMATMSSELSQAGQGLPDELLPAIIGLMESGGGQHMKNNNPYNIGPGIKYPDLRTSIIGGGDKNQKGLKGLLREGGPYQKYRDSGKLEDFFNTFTPPGIENGNPSMEELISRYKKLRLLFQ